MPKLPVSCTFSSGLFLLCLPYEDSLHSRELPKAAANAKQCETVQAVFLKRDIAEPNLLNDVIDRYTVSTTANDSLIPSPPFSLSIKVKRQQCHQQQQHPRHPIRRRTILSVS